MSTLPTHQELASWLSEKKYLSESCHTPHAPYPLAKIIDNTLSPAQENDLLKNIERPPSGSTIYEYGKRSFVGACSIADTTLALKYYHRLNLRRQLGYTMFGSHAMKAWIGSRVLHMLGIPTPRPIALFENKRFSCLADTSLLVTENIKGTPLPSYVHQYSNDAEKMTILKGHCQKIFDQLASYRIYHSDTAPKNFIVQQDSSVCIIDLDATKILVHPALWQKKRAKDQRLFMRMFPQSSPLHETFSSIFSND